MTNRMSIDGVSDGESGEMLTTNAVGEDAFRRVADMIDRGQQMSWNHVLVSSSG